MNVVVNRSSPPLFNEPYTNPIIIFTSLITASVHVDIFFCRLPVLRPVIVITVDFVGLVLRVVLMFHPREDSVEVAVFVAALAVDVLAITKMVNTSWEGKLFQHLVFPAMVRAGRMYFHFGWGSFAYVWGYLRALSTYYNLTKPRLNGNPNVGI